MLLTTNLATRRSSTLPAGADLSDTFRLIQEQAISAILGDWSEETSDEGSSTPTHAAGKPTSGLTLPEDGLQASSPTEDRFFWEDMSSDDSAAVTLGKALRKWDGRGGVPYLEWERDARTLIAQLRISKSSKGEPGADCSQEIEVLLGSVAPRYVFMPMR